MAHEFETGVFIKDIPWHKLGVVLPNVPTLEEAIHLSGLDWKVNAQALYTGASHVESHVAMVRDRDDAILGIVGKNYVPLQNTEAFKFFQPFIDSGEVSIESAGSLREGKRIWVLCKMNRDPGIIMPGDEVEKYILLANAHDGSMGATVKFTGIRVVCMNTMSAALGDQGKAMVVRHRTNLHLNLEQVRQTIDIANQNFEKAFEAYRAIAKVQMDAKSLADYVQKVFSSEDSKRLSAAQRKVVDLFEYGKGAKYAKRTLWGAYNAVAEYVQYERGRINTSDDARLNEAWFGAGKQLTDRALEIAVRKAA